MCLACDMPEMLTQPIEGSEPGSDANNNQSVAALILATPPRPADDNATGGARGN